MLGAIIGDVIGSAFERHSTKNRRFNLWNKNTRFTDDTVLTLATIESLLRPQETVWYSSITGKREYERKFLYKAFYQHYGKQYPNAGYGASFKEWIKNPDPYKSWGNGSAMRVSPIGWFFNTEREVLREARKSAEVSHNHKEGIKGAQAVALAVFYARKGKSKTFIKERLEKRFKYNLSRSTSEIKKTYKFDVSCQGSVPESIICFLESNSFMDAIRRAVAMGGDADTMGACSGSISEAFYKKIPTDVFHTVMNFYFTKEKLDLLSDFYLTIGVDFEQNKKFLKLNTI